MVIYPSVWFKCVEMQSISEDGDRLIPRLKKLCGSKFEVDAKPSPFKKLIPRLDGKRPGGLKHFAVNT